MTADPTPVLGAEETVLNEGGYSFVIRDDYAVITGYSGPGGTLDIPWSLGGVEVREIREESFAGNETLIVVNMPGSITKIGARAFAGCTNLINVLLPSALESLAAGVFEDCVSLASILIPAPVRSIGENAFKGCRSLIYVYFQGSGLLTSVGKDAFDGTPWLEAQTDEFVIAGNSVLIQYNGSAKQVTLPWNAYYVGSAFADNTEIEEVTLAEWTKGILPGAFRGASALKTVRVYVNLERIGENAFADCVSLESIAFPVATTSIGRGAFENCQNLKEVALPPALKKLEANLFRGCKSLERIVIPDAVTEIGSGAFEGCWSLNYVQFGISIEKIGTRAFAGTSALSSILLPSSLREIGSQAFANCGLKSIRFPDRVKTLGAKVFEGCFRLDRVALPLSLESIGSPAFTEPQPLLILPDRIVEDPGTDSDALRAEAETGESFIEQFIRENQFQYTYEPVETNMYRFRRDAATQTYTILEPLRQMPRFFETPETFNGAPVTGIGTAAFQEQKWIEELTIGDSYTWIGEWAFSFGSKLRQVTLGDSIRQIGADAFSGNPELETVVIPPSVESIGARAFADCPKLTIVGTAGSGAESFALENGIPFREM